MTFAEWSQVVVDCEAIAEQAAKSADPIRCSVALARLSAESSAAERAGYVQHACAIDNIAIDLLGG